MTFERFSQLLNQKVRLSQLAHVVGPESKARLQRAVRELERQLRDGEEYVAYLTRYLQTRQLVG